MKRTFATILAITATCAAIEAQALAKSLPVHQVEAAKPLYLRDGDSGASYAHFPGASSSNWQEFTKQGFSHAIAYTPAGQYEFRLVFVQSSNNGGINGLWDIFRNGVPACDNCVGKVYGLNGAVGDYFKIYVGSPAGYAERWHYSGYITNRFDY